MAAFALGVAAAARAHGAYDVSVWALVGLLLVGCAAGLAAAGRRPARGIAGAACAVLALGGWSAASTAWGGLPHEAWRALGLSLVSAAALLVGSMLVRGAATARAVAGGALVGVVALSVEVLARAATGALPGDWLYGRVLEGPVGHHNAQAALGVVAIPLAVAAGSARSSWLRAGGMGCAGILLAVVLLTQSRAAVLALVVVALTQALWSRNREVSLRLASLAPAGLALWPSLRRVDAALVAKSAAEDDALRSFALVALLVAAGLAATGLVRLPYGHRWRSLAAVAAVFALGAAVVAGVSPSLGPSASVSAGALTGDPRDAAPGETRFASVDLNGRQDAWRVAAAMARDSPVLGAGQGQFARRWAEDRRLGDLYILQPHSLELELLSELGIVGLTLFVLAIALVLAALARAPERGHAAAAAAGLVGLLVHASLDWVWWFPGVVAPVLIVAAAAAGGGRTGARRRRRTTAAVGLALVATTALGLPYVADAQLAQGVRLTTRDPFRAETHLRAARRLEPWDPATLSAEGRLAEAQGRFEDAAAFYAAAARLSQRPWLDHFREARALRRSGMIAASRAACRRAVTLNPREPLLRSGHCRP